MSRGLRPWVEYGNIEYSAVRHPPLTPCSFIQRGTVSSIVTPQMTRVFPIATKTDPLAYGAIPISNETGRSWLAARPSLRLSGGFNRRQITQIRAISNCHQTDQILAR